MIQREFFLLVAPSVLVVGLLFSPSIAQENPPAQPASEPKSRAEQEAGADLKRMEKDLQEMKEQIDRLRRDLEGAGPPRSGRLHPALPNDEFLEIGPGFPPDARRGLAPGGLVRDDRYRGRGLGIRVREVDPTLASQLKLEKGQGVVIEQVLENSPASAGGLAPHDIVLLLNGRAIIGSGASSAAAALMKAVADAPTGKPVPMEVIRGGEKTRLDVTLKAKETPAEGGARKA